MLGLYIHIPFCSAICNYCNFNRGLFDGPLKLRYVDALVREIECLRPCEPEAEQSRGRASAKSRAGGGAPAQLKRSWPAAADTISFRPDASRVEPEQSRGRASAKSGADTIFFGGGTPSLLEPDEIARIIRACRASFDLSADAEITMEANPETVTEDRLRAYRDAGITRLSFGVQSFRDEELRRLSRLHTADRARAALAEARGAGFDNVSLDLMMWLPEQRVADWLQSVDAAIALAPDHLSLYLLEVYPNAPLKDDMARARWSQAPDEDAEAMYLTAMERLESAGLAQYEISNVARAGRRSRHNMKYWTDGEWLGFGCGAHSTRGGVRWKNVSSTEEYVGRIGQGQPTAVDIRRLSRDEQLGDALFTGLRLTEGVDLSAVESRYGVDVWSRHGADLGRYVEAGVLVHEASRLRLTRRGMLLAHEVMAVFV